DEAICTDQLQVINEADALDDATSDKENRAADAASSDQPGCARLDSMRRSRKSVEDGAATDSLITDDMQSPIISISSQQKLKETPLRSNEKHKPETTAAQIKGEIAKQKQIHQEQSQMKQQQSTTKKRKTSTITSHNEEQDIGTPSKNIRPDFVTPQRKAERHSTEQQTVQKKTNTASSITITAASPSLMPDPSARLDSTQKRRDFDEEHSDKDSEDEGDASAESAVVKKLKELEKKYDKLRSEYERLKCSHNRLKQSTIPKPDAHTQKYLISIAEHFKAEVAGEDQFDRFAETLRITTARLLLCTRTCMTKTTREILKTVLTPEEIASYKSKDDVAPEVRAAIHDSTCSDSLLVELLSESQFMPSVSPTSTEPKFTTDNCTDDLNDWHNDINDKCNDDISHTDDEFNRDEVTSCKCENIECSEAEGYTQTPLQLLHMPIKPQVTEILARSPHLNIQLQSKQSRPIIKDIYDGIRYRSVCENEVGKFLSLTMNTDGIQVSKSSNLSLWVISFVINEIQRKERFKMNNAIIAGICSGSSKPSRNQMRNIFNLIVKELLVLQNGHYYEVASLDSSMIKLKLHLLVACCDKPAAAMIQNIGEPQGIFGCGRCHIEGIYFL
ncbi:unnamed protein product, partial [Didymodactylos carnosus]